MSVEIAFLRIQWGTAKNRNTNTGKILRSIKLGQNHQKMVPRLKLGDIWQKIGGRVKFGFVYLDFLEENFLFTKFYKYKWRIPPPTFLLDIS